MLRREHLEDVSRRKRELQRRLWEKELELLRARQAGRVARGGAPDEALEARMAALRAELETNGAGAAGNGGTANVRNAAGAGGNGAAAPAEATGQPGGPQAALPSHGAVRRENDAGLTA